MVLPKDMRIKGYRSFDYIHKTGVRYNSASMLLKITNARNELIQKKDPLSKPTSSCRCAVSISNKVSKRAVIRNSLRRTLHEQLKLRLFNESSYKNNWILISLRPNSLEKGHATLLKELDRLLSKAGISNA